MKTTFLILEDAEKLTFWKKWKKGNTSQVLANTEKKSYWPIDILIRLSRKTYFAIYIPTALSPSSNTFFICHDCIGRDYLTDIFIPFFVISYLNSYFCNTDKEQKKPEWLSLSLPPLNNMGLIVPVLPRSLCVYIRVNSRAAWNRARHILHEIFSKCPIKRQTQAKYNKLNKSRTTRA